MCAARSDLRATLSPLIVGVTGHRDLLEEDIGKLENKVREVFQEFASNFPSTPIVVLTALAEGADRLVARAALECKARLIVPLPMPQKVYEREFTSADSRTEFHHLLGQAQRHFVLKLFSDEEALANPGHARDRQYQELGKYIAHESQILIALWDGVRSDKVGGTANVVQFQLEGTHEKTASDLQPPELFPVYQVVTPRRSHREPVEKPFELLKHYPQGFANEREAEDYYSRVFSNLDDFNHAIVNADDSVRAKATESKEYLLSGFNEDILSPAESLDVERYAIADALAQGFQHTTANINHALHWMIFAAVLGFVCFAHLPDNPSWWWLAGSFVLLGAAYALYRYSAATKLDAKGQDYRAIAEGARVRFFWRLAQIYHQSVADNYLGKLRTELDWIRNALRGWDIENSAEHRHSEGSAAQREERLQAVRELWIGGQIKYFKHAHKTNEEALENREFLIRVSVLLILATAVAALVVRYRFPGVERMELHWLVIGVDTLIAAAALLHHATHQKAYDQHIKQFRRMESVFTQAGSMIDERLKVPDFEGVQRCLTELGQEALSENGDWVLLHRERPLELPPP